MARLQKRRDFIKTAGVAGAMAIAAPYVKGCSSAGKLSLGIWDHWILFNIPSSIQQINDTKYRHSMHY